MTDKSEEFKNKNQTEKEPEMREVDGKKEYLDEETNEWVSKNEHKKRHTLRKKTKEAAEKALKKAETKPAGETKIKKADAANDEELDPSKYTDMRKNFIHALRAEGKNPYPHKFNREISIVDFKKKFDDMTIENGSFLEDQKVGIAGRIMMLRESGAKLIFIDLVEGNAKV